MGFVSRLNDGVNDHLKKCKTIFVFLAISILLGLILGLVLVFSDVGYTGVLAFSNKNIFAYINGTATSLNIFFEKLIETAVSFILIYVFCLSTISSILSFVFISYQSMLLVITSSALINLYGFAGILNVVLLLVPINVCLILVFCLAISVGVLRVQEAKKYHEPFGYSFKINKFYSKYFICFLLMVALCAIYAFGLAIVLKSFLLYLY